MQNKLKTTTSITVPLIGLKYLYRSPGGKKLVLEVDIDSLKKVNQPRTIDEMFAEARLEYFSGKTKNFTSTDKLLKYLKE